MIFFGWLRPKREEKPAYNPIAQSTIDMNYRILRTVPDWFGDAWDREMDPMVLFKDDLESNTETAVATSSEVSGFEAEQILPTSLDLKEGEPDCFEEHEGKYPYRGQTKAKQRISARINTLRAEERFKCLMVGPAGTGKTTLARIIALRLNVRREQMGEAPGPYYELLPAQLENRKVLDDFMLQLSQKENAVVFIDEIHKLMELERWFHVLHDTGTPRWPMADGRMIDIPRTVSFIGATTDPGLLDNTSGGAMRRRLEPEIRLEAPDVATLTQIVLDTARGVGMDIAEDAADTIAVRSHFPWFAKMIFNEVQLLARLERITDIPLSTAVEALDMLEIDDRGLRREDRDVILALLRVKKELVTKPGVFRHSMSEEALCASAGIDRGTYKKRVQPKLLRLGLLMTLGGQCLTDDAVREYGFLLKK
jgi:Holliday junction resolvasome RuvABC ATP-dependent DNA helicase subunit